MVIIQCSINVNASFRRGDGIAQAAAGYGMSLFLVLPLSKINIFYLLFSLFCPGSNH